MSFPTFSATLYIHSILCLVLLQSAPPATAPQRIHLNQEQFVCSALNIVEPIYPHESRLSHTEGLVKLILIIADNGTVADLQPVSGDPLLLDSAVKAVRQWRFGMAQIIGQPKEYEVPLTFTFNIIPSPRPAFITLTTGKTLRADTVREFSDHIEYTALHRTHRLAPNSVTNISSCLRFSLAPGKGNCVPSGGPQFSIRAFPLLPTDSPHTPPKASTPRAQIP